jgi:ribonuclease T2
MRFLAMLAFMISPAFAEGEQAGDFDYFVLALSWSPNWCTREGDARGASQCDDRHDYGWTLHGLWPQFDSGWPSYCRTSERDPTRSMTGSMVDIMGSSGLAFHQWKKHGRCAGFDAVSYFDLSREAYQSIARPEVFRKLDTAVRLPAGIVEEAFLKANPDLEPDMVTITCRNAMIAEVRVCLSKDLEPRTCGPDVVRDCQMDRALFHPVR